MDGSRFQAKGASCWNDPRSNPPISRARDCNESEIEAIVPMHGLAYEGSFGVFLLVTIVLGGGAAALTGRAVASTWRPRWQILVYTLILAAVVRFFHHALFGGTLLSPHYYLVDGI